ncbi:MAG: hypothetical protein AAF203_09355, partial [Pseudomonadota bacterium]
ILSLFLALGLGVFAGKKMSTGNQVTKTIVKTYPVDPDRIDEAEYSLKELFKPIADKASVKAIGNNALIVRFPKSFKKGIDEAMRQFVASLPEVEKKVLMDYWILHAADEKVPFGTAKTADLDDVIRSIESVEPGKHYRILEHLSSNSSSGHKAEVRGMVSKIESRIHVAADDIKLKLRFKSDFGSVFSKTKMKNGEFVVIGQNGVHSKKLRGELFDNWGSSENIKNSKVYYVVRARLVN